MSGCNILFPGIKCAERFDVWRLSSSSDTVVFNFGRTVENTEEAISVIKAHFGEHQIAAARQVTAIDLQLQVLSVELFNDPNIRAQLYEMKSRQDWIVEVLFANPQARQNALKYGLIYGEHAVLPQSTVCATREFTALGVRDMALQTPEDALKSFRELTQCALDRPPAATKSNATPAVTSSFADVNIKHIFLRTDAEGTYDGSGTVILEGYYPKLTGPQGGIALRASDRLGFVTVQMKRCFLYCENCCVLDDHHKEDCFEVMTETEYAIVKDAQVAAVQKQKQTQEEQEESKQQQDQTRVIEKPTSPPSPPRLRSQDSHREQSSPEQSLQYELLQPAADLLSTHMSNKIIFEKEREE